MSGTHLLLLCLTVLVNNRVRRYHRRWVGRVVNFFAVNVTYFNTKINYDHYALSNLHIHITSKPLLEWLHSYDSSPPENLTYPVLPFKVTEGHWNWHIDPVASEAICKWGAQCRRKFFWCAPHFSLVPPPHMREHNDCLLPTERQLVKSGEGQ